MAEKDKKTNANINPNLNQSVTQEEGSAFGHNMSLISVVVRPEDKLKTPESDYFHRLNIGLENEDNEGKANS